MTLTITLGALHSACSAEPDGAGQSRARATANGDERAIVTAAGGEAPGATPGVDGSAPARPEALEAAAPTWLSTEFFACDATCPDGGVRIQWGVDQNRDGRLDSPEITDTSPVCNRRQPYGLLVKTSEEPSESSHCALGGARIDMGYDTNNDQILNAAEIHRSDFICSGPSSPRPKIRSIAAGEDTTCAILTDGTGRCWGFGFGDPPGPLPTLVAGLDRAVSVSVGTGHACALIEDGTVRCWGNNSFGELGNGTTVNSTAAVRVEGLRNAISVSVGGGSCALLADRTVRCWGRIYNGRWDENSNFVEGSEITSSIPVEIAGLRDVAGVSAGLSSSCALLQDGRVYCWGNNWGGQLGNGTRTDSVVPVQVSSLNDVIGITAGYQHGCAARADGSVWCWGDTPFVHSMLPERMAGVSGAVSLSSTRHFTCAGLQDKTVSCWPIVISSGVLAQVPRIIAGVNDVTSASAGSGHGCALSSDGTARCWAQAPWGNASGELGAGSSASNVQAPVRVTVY
jgi:alpha-tubulin suppressor-like RCC1 family protein